MSCWSKELPKDPPLQIHMCNDFVQTLTSWSWKCRYELVFPKSTHSTLSEEVKYGFERKTNQTKTNSLLE